MGLLLTLLLMALGGKTYSLLKMIRCFLTLWLTSFGLVIEVCLSPNTWGPTAEHPANTNSLSSDLGIFSHH